MAGGTWVEVAQGESAESVAYRHGHAVATVWDDPENRALRETRGSPHTLHPGDRLLVPALRPGEAACATSRVHTFRRRGVPSGITLSLGVAGRALADLPYELRVDGAMLAGRTGADGGVTVKVMPDAREAVLVVDPDGLALTFDLLPRHLDLSPRPRGGACATWATTPARWTAPSRWRRCTRSSASSSTKGCRPPACRTMPRARSPAPGPRLLILDSPTTG